MACPCRHPKHPASRRTCGCGAAERAAVERSLATDLLAVYAVDQPQLLFDLLLDAEPTQFVVLFRPFQALQEQFVPIAYCLPPIPSSQFTHPPRPSSRLSSGGL